MRRPGRKVKIVVVVTLLLFVTNNLWKPFWSGWNATGSTFTPCNGTQLSKLASISLMGASSHKALDGQKQCPICGHKNVSVLGKKSLTKGWDNKFNLTWMGCSECGHKYVWPYLSDKNLSDIYSTSYSHQDQVREAKFRGDSQFKLLQQLELVTPQMKHLEVLEQGCAHGAFLNYFANFSSKLICLEPDNDVNASLITGESRKKLTLIRSVEVNDELVPDNSVDFWLGSHVMELFADPNRFIASAHRKLKLGGIFFQEVPMREGLPKGDNPHNYHLHYFSGKSIHLALIKHGFCQIAINKLTTKRYRGPEFWPDVSKTEMQNVKQKTHDALRVSYNKCLP